MTIPLEPSWRAALVAAGARFVDDRPADYGDPSTVARACAGEPALCDLAQLAVVRIEGADAVEFLHGQFTADLQGLSPAVSTLAGYCTPKGRLLAVLRVWHDLDDGLWMVLPRSVAPAIVTRLRMYVLRARVTIAEPDAGLAAFGLTGADTPDVVGRWAGAWPADPGGVIRSGRLQAVRVPGPVPRVMLVGRVEGISGLWHTWRADRHLVSGRCWEWMDIAAALPWVHAGTMEAFLPQALNLDALDAVSFRKGCYPGQEIVARTRYLGRVKQRMFPAHGPAGEPPARGDKVYCAALGDQAAGYVVEALAAPGGGWDALVTAPRAAAATRPLHLGSVDGPALVTGDPPYPLPPDEEVATPPSMI